jgi:hypothetical protein
MNRALVVLVAALCASCGLLNFASGDAVGPPLQIEYVDDGIAEGEGEPAPCDSDCCADDGSCACDGDTCACGSTWCKVNRDDDGAECAGAGCTSSCTTGTAIQCAQDQELCDDVLELCTDPEDVTADCEAADLFDQPRADDGPILTDIFTWSPDGAADCWQAQVQVLDPDGDVPEPPEDPQIMSVDEGGLLPAVTADGASFVTGAFTAQDGFFILHACIPDTATEPLAVRIYDALGHESNRYCIDAP